MQNCKFYVDFMENLLNKIKQESESIHKDIFACLFSIHNIISLSCHEQVSLSGLRLIEHIPLSQIKMTYTKKMLELSKC